MREGGREGGRNCDGMGWRVCGLGWDGMDSGRDWRILPLFCLHSLEYTHERTTLITLGRATTPGNRARERRVEETSFNRGRPTCPCAPRPSVWAPQRPLAAARGAQLHLPLELRGVRGARDAPVCPRPRATVAPCPHCPECPVCWSVPLKTTTATRGSIITASLAIRART